MNPRLIYLLLPKGDMMKKSDFQFSNPYLTKLNFKINDDFDKDGYNGGMSIESEITQEVITPDEEARVSLLLKLGNESNFYPFYFEIEMTALFKIANLNSKINYSFSNLINTNAPAMLLSYARPIISLITSQSGMPAFYIPFINFTSDKEKTP